MEDLVLMLHYIILGSLSKYLNYKMNYENPLSYALNAKKCQTFKRLVHQNGHNLQESQLSRELNFKVNLT